MFSCERWLILARSKVMLTLLGDVFLWTLAHFGTFKSYVDIVGWCFPNVFLWTLAHFGTVKSYVDIVGWCFPNVFLWTLAHFGTFKSYVDIVGWCFPNVFLWTLAHFGTFKSYVDIVGWCFPNVFLWTLAHFGTFKSYVDIVGWCFPVNVGSFWHCWVMFSECFPVNVGSFWHFQKLCWHCWVMFPCERWLILALSKVMLTLLGDVFLWTLAHFGTVKSYVDIVGWCFPVNVGSFWHFQKLCWHCWVMFSECFPVNVGSFWHFQKLCWHCWVMFPCERWLILALSKVMLTLLGDVFLWTLAHFGTVKSYVDIVGWCFPVNVGSFWHF